MNEDRNQDAVAYISTFPPRQCGIGTFTNSLSSACLGQMDGRLRSMIVAIDNPSAEYDYPDMVKHKIDQGARVDYVEAAEFVNYSNVGVVSLQHEFGIFGGPDGAYVLDMLRELRCPVVTTFHTILDQPSEGQQEVMDELIVLSQRLVVMSRKGVGFLQDIYNAPDEKIKFIHHGVEQLPLVEPDLYKDQFDMEGRQVILTFGLLSPGKGIEYMIEALPPVVEKHPDLCYIVLGATHPEIKEREGESYRLKLQRRARDLGLQKNVLFIGRFVEQEELCEFLKAADIYVTPYPNREQITSGTLAYALGAGKPIVSTRYWYAEELLGDGRGILVDFQNSEALSDGLLQLLDNPDRLRDIRAEAYEYSRDMVWPEVGRQYIDTFRSAMSAARVRSAMPDTTMRHLLPITGLPRPKLNHLSRLTDDTGLLQHAHFSVPNRQHGYTTDDNARGMVVAAKYLDLFNDDEAERLLNIYLSFVHYAQREDGLFRNFMSYDRQFIEEVGSDDCLGRALWGLGYVIYRGNRQMLPLATELFENSVENQNLLEMLSLRGRANAILGFYYYLQRYPEAHDIEPKIDALAGKNLDAFHAHTENDWLWFEPYITYDNAMLPHSLLLAHEITGKEDYLDVGVQSLDFLLGKSQSEDGHLSFVGNNGWHQKDDEPAQFDQQPIDACGLVEACKTAFRATGQREYLRHMRTAFDWFLGVNDLGVPLYDFSTGACADGLTAEGPNQNQGAESTLCCMLSLLTLTEIYSEQDRIMIRSRRAAKTGK
ncbi:MAG: glycosyltransferase [Planctomycetes bacterium]|nr:glycosyltransferase [Planctomycetota bacterium]